MTGFGHGTAESERIRATVTLRGVNHRYLDLVLRVRDEYRDAEPALRSLFAGRLERGRVEAVVEIEPLGAAPIEVVMNEELAEALRGLQQNLVERGLVHGGLSFTDLLRLPEVVRLRPRAAAEWTAADEETVLRAAERALEQLVATRETEGEKLRATFLPRLDGLAEIAARLRARRAAVAEETFRSLQARVEELLRDQLTGTFSADRLAQEVAYLVDRSDVAEELDRLASHLEHFRAIMEGDGSLGKRLDFLAQEIFRELNTLGSKCRDSEMVREVLDGKVLCEQIREQVQNVE
jgi:uncharacterized protein (TIGR00255 family)